MEYWTDDGLSTVASGVGTQLYVDRITKDYSILDFALVCVMLDYNSTLPRHLIVISSLLRDGKEVPTRVDIEYEWLPQHCKQCCSLGHTASNCPDSTKKKHVIPLTVFVKKHNSQSGVAQAKLGAEMDIENDVAGSKSAAGTGHTQVCKKDPLSSTTHSTHINNMEEGRLSKITNNKRKDIVIFNSYGVLDAYYFNNEAEAEFDDEISSPSPNSRSPILGDP
ncbi:UNVERIFIED_CONTAM: hypothetical protein Sangu_3013600 [Sesamum angustifolium]|uniref:CCHC-type domain-containing protein n=1 Tax=Sesamum angustifolium TaxID=2727405 RepID=A0AAW2KMM9_9LAMI